MREGVVSPFSQHVLYFTRGMGLYSPSGQPQTPRRSISEMNLPGSTELTMEWESETTSTDSTSKEELSFFTVTNTRDTDFGSLSSSWSTDDDDSSSIDTALSEGPSLESVDNDDDTNSKAESESELDVDDILQILNPGDSRKVFGLTETASAFIVQNLHPSSDDDQNGQMSPSLVTPTTPSCLSDDDDSEYQICRTPASDSPSFVVIPQSHSPHPPASPNMIDAISPPPELSELHFSWSCLFALSNPKSHMRCLRHEHGTPEALLHHLFGCHLRIPYCYRCGETFDFFIERNSHYASTQCQVVTPAPVHEGIGEGMIYELKHLVSSWGGQNRENEPVLSNDEKYGRLWSVVFPEEEDDFQERFPCGVGEDPVVRAVHSARSYWARHGRRVVEGNFEGKTGRELDQLHVVILDRILRRVLLEEMVRRKNISH